MALNIDGISIRFRRRKEVENKKQAAKEANKKNVKHLINHRFKD